MCDVEILCGWSISDPRRVPGSKTGTWISEEIFSRDPPMTTPRKKAAPRATFPAEKQAFPPFFRKNKCSAHVVRVPSVCKIFSKHSTQQPLQDSLPVKPACLPGA